MDKNKQQLIKEILDRGIIREILPTRDDFEKRLLNDDKLSFYIGADPTSNSLHLSHAKNYMVLEDFRKLGHKVFVLIGDFTARIGDPTEKATTRKQLSREEVLENVKSWVAQIKPLMDFEAKVNPPEIVYNNDWLAKLTMEDVINLASNVTVQRMLERDMFQKRMTEEKPIYLHEFMYPLMQGYDSVALNVDVELCGTDQIFNALMGRTLVKKLRNKDKFVVAVNLMENPVTGELMSKSRGTGIFLNFSSEDMYGAIMAQPDEMIRVFLVNNTRIPLYEIDEILRTGNPRDAKMKTAHEITKIFHGDSGASLAQEAFVKKIQKKEAPEDLEIIKIGASEENVFNILKKSLKDKSNSDIKRLVEQGAVRINDRVYSDLEEVVKLGEAGLNMNVGKRTWLKITQ
ncbi:MAG: tyrosine--tRNA ligase [Patescibacteria group bacterium]